MEGKKIPTPIVKLNNSNYSVWKFKMELLLMKKGVWDAVMEYESDDEDAVDGDDTSITTSAAKLKKLDNKARALIGLHVEDDQLVHIRNEKTALGSWNALKKYHEKHTLSNKVHIIRSICELKLKRNGKAQTLVRVCLIGHKPALVVAHITYPGSDSMPGDEGMTNLSRLFLELFQKLQDVNEKKLCESWNVAMLLSSLGGQYNTLITALEGRQEEDLTLAFVEQKILSEYERQTKDKNEESGLKLQN